MPQKRQADNTNYHGSERLLIDRMPSAAVSYDNGLGTQRCFPTRQLSDSRRHVPAMTAEESRPTGRPYRRVAALNKSIPPEVLAAWVGRSVEAEDLVTAPPVRRLAATLGHDGAHWPAGVLPPLGHWLFHLPEAPREALGDDGHPRRGGLLPPIGYPRRMWAGGRLTFLAPVPFGAVVMKRSTVVAIVEKPGMTFVTVRHDLSVAGVSAVIEEQDLVFLPIAAPAAAQSLARPVPEGTRDLVADEALLFRYSALTFNAHRIHYDLAYAREVELYPALVVHGPLQATLLIDLAMTAGVVPATFSFRARAPLYCGRRFTLAMAGTELWIVDEAGVVTMTAGVEAR